MMRMLTCMMMNALMKKYKLDQAQDNNDEHADMYDDERSDEEVQT